MVGILSPSLEHAPVAINPVRMPARRVIHEWCFFMLFILQVGVVSYFFHFHRVEEGGIWRDPGDFFTGVRGVVSYLVVEGEDGGDEDVGLVSLAQAGDGGPGGGDLEACGVEGGGGDGVEGECFVQGIVLAQEEADAEECQRVAGLHEAVAGPRDAYEGVDEGVPVPVLVGGDGGGGVDVVLYHGFLVGEEVADESSGGEGVEGCSPALVEEDGGDDESRGGSLGDPREGVRDVVVVLGGVDAVVDWRAHRVTEGVRVDGGVGGFDAQDINTSRLGNRFIICQ